MVIEYVGVSSSSKHRGNSVISSSSSDELAGEFSSTRNSASAIRFSSPFMNSIATL